MAESITVEELVASVKEAVDDRISPLLETIKELTVRLDNLEAASAGKSDEELDALKTAVDGLLGARKSLDGDADTVATKSAEHARDPWGRRVRS